MHRFSFVFLVACTFVLSGCYFKSDISLHDNMKSYKPSQFYSQSESIFVEHGSRKTYITVKLGDDGRAFLTRYPDSSATNRSMIDFVTHLEGYPFYFGVRKTKTEYQYFPFQFYGDKGFRWIKPLAKQDKPKTQAQLLQFVQNALDKRNAKRFVKIPDNKAAQTIAFVLERKEKHVKSKQKQQVRREQKKEQALDLLDVGDGVYVQGFFSDELAMIVRINRANGTVKVRRSKDGTTKWVHHSKVISREQSTANDVVRTIGGGAIIYCLVVGCGEKR